MRISDWSSDVCSSDLSPPQAPAGPARRRSRAGPAATGRGAGRDGGARRSEERRVGKSVSVRVDLGGSRIIKKTKQTNRDATNRVRTYMRHKHHNSINSMQLSKLITHKMHITAS